MHFRPCIDIHNGQVKQIVGSSLEKDPAVLQTNFVSDKEPDYFAQLYKKDGLMGGHVIMLGPGNKDAAKKALQAAPNTLQVGGGITADNAEEWLAAGAEKVIVTSFLFEQNDFSKKRLDELGQKISKDKLVIDLSCRKSSNGKYYVACNRWQTRTSLEVHKESLQALSAFCSEFLIHAVDVEGKQSGIDPQLVELLASSSPIPVTYAGGVQSLDDVRLIKKFGGGKIDFTVGSALDLFGGKRLKYSQLVELEHHDFRNL